MVRREQGNIAFVGMAGHASEEDMQEFVDRYGLEPMPQAVSVDGSLWGRFGVPAQPAWVFVRPDGTYEVHLGALAPDRLQATLDAL